MGGPQFAPCVGRGDGAREPPHS